MGLLFAKKSEKMSLMDYKIIPAPAGKRKIILSVLFGLYLIIIVAFALILMKSNKNSSVLSPSPTLTPTPSSSQTAYWKNYTNDFGKFSLKYPPSLTVKEKSLSNQERQVIFSGTEGNMTINVAVPKAAGWGGGCDPEFHQEINFLGKKTSACLNEVSLRELYGYHPTGSSAVNIAANFAAPYSQNREIFLKILSGFDFLK